MSQYLLVPVVAGCVIQRDNQYLLVQEKQLIAYGLWNLPAGHLEKGETFEEAAIRETFEETGFKVELEQKLETVHTGINQPVLHAYKARILSGKIKFDPEAILDVQWFTLKGIEQLQATDKLRNAWVINSIKQTLPV